MNEEKNIRAASEKLLQKLFIFTYMRKHRMHLFLCRKLLLLVHPWLRFGCLYMFIFFHTLSFLFVKHNLPASMCIFWILMHPLSD